MARPSLKGVEYSFYFPSAEDKARWKRLAHPLTLNRWIYLQVERSLENTVESPDDLPDINTLRKENLDLRQENEALAARLERSQQDLAASKDSLPLEQSILGLFKLFIRGGTLTPAEINKQFFTEFHDDIDISKAVNKSLELLEDSELVEKTQTGWRLNKK